MTICALFDYLTICALFDRREISKAYRKLAQKWHPDMFRSQEDKEAAEKQERAKEAG